MMERFMGKLDVVIFQRDEWWVAQVLQHDIGAQALTVEDALYEIERSIVGHIAICLENGVTPFSQLGPAPQLYWDKFKLATNILTSTTAAFSAPVPIPAAEFRLAA
jgi:hypothetical protein